MASLISNSKDYFLIEEVRAMWNSYFNRLANEDDVCTKDILSAWHARFVNPEIYVAK